MYFAVLAGDLYKYFVDSKYCQNISPIYPFTVTAEVLFSRAK